ncbi:urease accessory protein UreF [Mycolicibacterium smegmatis]|jgi:urease accessory protein|uniref:Urease accessory protein UreF n=1 Tax=Mycolicibacterium smegmatis (strain MKD8) TaxID=1214915 RepID=A0A2U9PXP9_MYCSE|nr:urease accessory UreF family protein [Mycolicibacterium smegmatis]AWT56563.1 Urease accessory protein UreF [Mycolicibacterium smegmatis MKD8]MCP2624061.1 urease accessory protein UreF [Mycolicibacterium smegmatis]UGU28371.1 urease accessory protein UreF [Mycolicibacterium smegmatis]ULN69374.1 urease accessory protein UreF [Mycolicibacterium smegmatis]
MPATTTDHAALWLQLHDSAFPAGRMVHSHGLEEWLAARPDAGADAIEAVTIGYLTHAVAPLDATITAAAHRGSDSLPRLLELDELVSTYKLFDNARTASTGTGRQLAATACDIGIEHPYLGAVLTGSTAGHAAVVDAVVQARLGIPLEMAVLGSLRSMLAAMLSAAVRLGRLGPLQSQRIQLRTVNTVVDLTEQACRRSPEDVCSTAPTLEISAMRHEVRTARLFAT